MTGEFAAAWLPSILVPLVGILAPAVAMALLFNVIEARALQRSQPPLSLRLSESLAASQPVP